MGLAPVPRQVGAGDTAPLPMASADAFGASIGRSVADVGQSLERLDQVNRQVDANEQNAAGGKALADYHVKLIEAQQDAQSDPSLDADGYARKMAAWREANSAPVLAGVTDHRVQRTLSAQLDAINGNAEVADHGYVIGRRAAKLVTDENAAQDSSYALIRGSASLADAQPIVKQVTDAAHARIEGYTGISADQKDKMLRTATAGTQMAVAQLGIDTDPAKVRALADAGGFDALSPSQLETVYRGIDVAERQRAAAAAHQDALDKAAAREKVSLVNARLEAGEDVPDAELTQTAALAGSIGDDSGAYKLQVAQRRADINRATQGWLPQQYDARIADLRAKGDKRSAGEDIELDQLQKVAPQRSAELRHDPSAWAALNGRPAPALDFSDPATIGARRQWAASVSKATGLPTPLLTANEAQDLATQAEESPRARLDVIDQVAAIGAIDRRQAVNTMRQVLPSDDLAAHLVLLNQGNRAAAINGAEARKADRSLIDDMKAGGSGAAANDSYQANIAPALRLMRGGEAKATYDIAGNMYADWAVKNGVHTFNENQFDTFLQVALGARRDATGAFHGGVGYWRDQPVLLPGDVSADQLSAHLNRMSWSDKWQGAPAFSNGTVMTPAQVRQYVPVARPDGRYEFHGPGDLVLHDRKGAVWSVAIDAKGVHP